MRARIQLKKSTLSLSLPVLSSYSLCCSLMILPYSTYAADTLSNAASQLKSQNVSPVQMDALASEGQSVPLVSSEAVQMDASIFETDDLEALTPMPVDQDLMNEIYQIAEQAKQEAQAYSTYQSDKPVLQQQDLNISASGVTFNTVINEIKNPQSVTSSKPDEGQADLPDISENNVVVRPEKKQGFFQRVLNKFKTQPSVMGISSTPSVTVEVRVTEKVRPKGISDQAYDAGLEQLQMNVEAKLANFFRNYTDKPTEALFPQLRSTADQAAQAVGFYDAGFSFDLKSDANKLKVAIKPQAPVVVNSQQIEFSGAGANQSQFRVIGVLPELSDGDIFHHGKYEATKQRISTAASDNGYFDAYWRLHDVEVNVIQPKNTADINLRYETGERYTLAKPIFRMNGENQEIPLNDRVLASMVRWNEGDDYTAWRVDDLAQALTNSRYFNYSLVETLLPDPLKDQLEPAPGLEASIHQKNARQSVVQDQVTKDSTLLEPYLNTQSTSDAQFAGVTQAQDSEALTRLKAERAEKEGLRLQAREEKTIPVIVTLNADRLNTLEAGLGYGTDTGVRFRGQYRRAIVNERGHSFDANLELSETRQSIDGRYSIPYKHPVNDYISIVGGYEREQRDDVGKSGNLIIESAVLGADRIIQNPEPDSWQHRFGARYSLDRLTAQGDLRQNAQQASYLQFLSSPEQESLLLSYQLSKTTVENPQDDSGKNDEPSKVFKQSYKVALASESLLTDTDMAIFDVSWQGLYALGEDKKHQLIGGIQAGYIVVDDFKDTPYDLRYFAGGDQNIRGFDYKSLSPIVDGYKIGGQALGVASLEYNYQFKPNWRAAVFTDIGNAYDKDFSNPTEYSVGLGVRWKSPIGPIRIDVASGISDPGHPIRVHFFIGSVL